MVATHIISLTYTLSIIRKHNNEIIEDEEDDDVTVVIEEVDWDEYD